MSFKESGQSLPHQYFVDLAIKLPKIPAEEFTPFEREHGWQQYGNNFIMLFLEELEIRTNPKVDQSGLTHVQKMRQRYGNEWERFLEKNKDLIDKINQTLDEKILHSQLIRHHTDLLLEGNDLIADEFKPLVDSVGIYIWRKLSPLLEKAADQMEKEGIDAREFFA